MKKLTQLKLAVSFVFCLFLTFSLQAENEKPCAACAKTQVTLLVTKCTNPGAKCGANDSGVCTTETRTEGWPIRIKYQDCFCIKKAGGQQQVNLLEEEQIGNTVVAAGMNTQSRSWMLLSLLLILGLSFQYNSRKETSTL